MTSLPILRVISDYVIKLKALKLRISCYIVCVSTDILGSADMLSAEDNEAALQCSRIYYKTRLLESTQLVIWVHPLHIIQYKSVVSPILCPATLISYPALHHQDLFKPSSLPSQWRQLFNVLAGQPLQAPWITISCVERPSRAEHHCARKTRCDHNKLNIYLAPRWQQNKSLVRRSAREQDKT